MKKVHMASVEEATEGDNTTYISILCDWNEKVLMGPDYTEDSKFVTCKRCLKILKEF